MYRVINQQSYKYKILRFPLDCHLEKELLPILFDLYQKSTDLEVGDHKLTWLGFLKGNIFIDQENCYFQFTSYQRRRKNCCDCCESPLTKYTTSKAIFKSDRSQDYNRQSYRVTQYYSNPHFYSDKKNIYHYDFQLDTMSNM